MCKCGAGRRQIRHCLRGLYQHAMSVPDTVRHGASQVIFESYPTLGYNYRMTDIQAAVGREQLRRLPGIIEERRALAARYRELLGERSPGSSCPSSRSGRARTGRAIAFAYPRRAINAS